MPNTQFLSLAGSLALAGREQTNMAASVIHLFKSTFAPTPANVLADYLAAECDFDGYAPINVAVWGAPALAPVSGYMTFTPQEVFRWSHVASDVANMVGGLFIVDSGGNLDTVVIFNPAIGMTGPGNALPLTVAKVFPTTPVSLG